VIVLEVTDGELLGELERAATEVGIRDGAMILIGAVDEFTVSTMPADDATIDEAGSYEWPAELGGTGEFIDGKPHVHATLAIEGHNVRGGHLLDATVSTHFVRAYVIPVATGREDR